MVSYLHSDVHQETKRKELLIGKITWPAKRETLTMRNRDKHANSVPITKSELPPVISAGCQVTGQVTKIGK